MYKKSISKNLYINSPLWWMYPPFWISIKKWLQKVFFKKKSTALFLFLKIFHFWNSKMKKKKFSPPFWTLTLEWQDGGDTYFTSSVSEVFFKFIQFSFFHRIIFLENKKLQILLIFFWSSSQTKFSPGFKKIKDHQ
jgi:hypothetical protein